LNKFSFFAQPNSLQEKQSITNRLALLQVKNAGVKISGKKIYDAFINDGEYNESVKEFYAEQEKDIEMAAKLNAEIKKAQNEIENPVASAVAGVLGNNDNKEGRPASNEAPASLQQKKDENGTPRSVLATS
jgi:thymidine phosphorylase